MSDFNVIYILNQNYLKINNLYFFSFCCRLLHQKTISFTVPSAHGLVDYTVYKIHSSSVLEYQVSSAFILNAYICCRGELRINVRLNESVKAQSRVSRLFDVEA